MSLTKCVLVAFSLMLSACAGVTQPVQFQGAGVVTKDVYVQSKASNGVVLMDINWGRWWGCGGRGNAQLISLAFDRLPRKSFVDDSVPSLVIHGPSRLMVDPVFLNYAFSLEPGEYALSAFSIKVADSPSEVGFLTAKRSHLYKDGKPIGGTFVVKPGETVFIGNFYLDCTYGPTLWRYYPKGRANFEHQLAEYKNSFPFLDLGDVQYRLFKTSKFGHDYELVP